MKKLFYEKLVAYVNRKLWWHAPPVDPSAYQQRGMFLSSSYAECEFYGRPLDEPKRVTLSKPPVGDEKTIERKLFGHLVTDFRAEPLPVEDIFSLDAKRRRLALLKGYDSIVLMSPKCFAEWRATGKIPRSMELNVLEVSTGSNNQGRNGPDGSIHI